MKNSLNGRYHTRVVVNIIYSTVVACMVMVFLVTNLSMIGQYAAERGMENSLALLFYRPGTMIVLLYVLLGDRSFFRQFSAAPEPFHALHFQDFLCYARDRGRRSEYHPGRGGRR